MKDEFVRRAVVTDVYDGDSITVDIDLGFNTIIQNQSVRLARVDTPELRSYASKKVFASEKALGMDIQEWMHDLLIDKTIYLKSTRKPSFGRIICECWLEIDDKILHLNQYLIDHGIAREYHNKGDFDDKWSLNWFNDFGRTLFLEWKESQNEDLNIIK